MMAFRRVLFAAALAGVLTGAAVTAVHALRAIPLILQAESYEKAPSQGGQRPPAGTPWSDPGRLALTALVEVHTRQELEMALTSGARLLGINNRDLKSFEVSLETTFALLPFVPTEVVLVSESGISQADEVARLASAGVDAILVQPIVFNARTIDLIIEAKMAIDKPFLVSPVLTDLWGPELARKLAEAGIPNFPSPERAMRAYAAARRYHRFRSGE